MQITRIDSNRDIKTECKRIEIQVGSARITLEEAHGQLVVHGDDDDLMISCGSRNTFTIITSKN